MAGPEIKTKADLLKTHKKYQENIRKWKFYIDAYNGDDEFIRKAIFKNERESVDNHKNRLKEAVCFNYSSAMVDIFNHFLTIKTVHRDMGILEQDRQWQLFMKDCNLDGMSFDDFLIEQQKIASIVGMCGVLIDKPNMGKKKLTGAQEAKLGVYPYVVPFSMPDIFDWGWKRDPSTGRMVLEFVKLRLSDDSFSIWTEEYWQVWTIDEHGGVGKTEGANPLGEVPFVWFYNIKDIFDPTIGKSDIVGVARIQASIARNMSCGDEILNYAGFPMLRMPKESQDAFYSGEVGGELGSIGDAVEYDDDDDLNAVVVSSRSVLEFDPEHPDAKPDWLETKVLDPIRAILEFVDRKTDEMYRTKHLSGIYNQRDKAQTKSGTALRYEYHQLNSVLLKKARNLTQSELDVVYFFLKWKRKESALVDMSIKRSDEFSIDELSETLDNAIKGVTAVKSQEFAKVMKKQIVEKLAPHITFRQRRAIYKEIENVIEEFIEKSSQQNQEDNGSKIADAA